MDLSALALGAAERRLRNAEPARTVDRGDRAGLTRPRPARLLRNLFDNLLGNAWKFTGQVAPRGSRSRDRDEGQRGYRVRDNGAGFDMAYAHQAVRALPAPAHGAEFAGTGIGLATVRRIVRGTAAGCGPRARSATAPRSTSRSRAPTKEAMR
jgi:nitrogen fixation/metabolism regulation signal transduction histidine kinase